MSLYSAAGDDVNGAGVVAYSGTVYCPYCHRGQALGRRGPVQCPHCGQWFEVKVGPKDNLTNILKNDTIELDTTGWIRLEVDGRFLGYADIWRGLIALYYRGRWQVYDFLEERQK